MVRRLAWVLSAVVLASVSVATAQPKKNVPAKKGPIAPAKDAPAAGSGSGSGSGDAGAGSAVQMTEDAPPSDMNGTDENPDNPHEVGNADNGKPKPPPSTAPAVYPIEEALRPITLFEGMAELSIAPHAEVSPFWSSDALRARYGITRQFQLGITYAFAGVYDDPATVQKQYAIHPGKAVGIDVTYLIQSWIGVRIGLPFYLNPFAMSLSIAAPIKFHFGDKFALGAFDDLLNIKLSKFPPSFTNELQNASAAQGTTTGTEQSAGTLRLSGYGIYQVQSNAAVTGRIGIDIDDLSGGSSTAGAGTTGTTQVFIRAGIDFTPRHWIDLGVSLGFDDLAHGGSFDPQLYLALRI